MDNGTLAEEFVSSFLVLFSEQLYYSRDDTLAMGTPHVRERCNNRTIYKHFGIEQTILKFTQIEYRQTLYTAISSQLSQQNYKTT